MLRWSAASALVAVMMLPVAAGCTGAPPSPATSPAFSALRAIQVPALPAGQRLTALAADGGRNSVSGAGFILSASRSIAALVVGIGQVMAVPGRRDLWAVGGSWIARNFLASGPA